MNFTSFFMGLNALSVAIVMTTNPLTRYNVLMMPNISTIVGIFAFSNSVEVANLTSRECVMRNLTLFTFTTSIPRIFFYEGINVGWNGRYSTYFRMTLQ